MAEGEKGSGPRGVVRIETTAHLASEANEAGERAEVRFVGADPSFTAGIWEAAQLAEDSAPYPSDEVCVVIDGEIRIDEPGGKSHVFRAGDVFALRRGAELAWSNTEGARKVFISLTPGESVIP